MMPDTARGHQDARRRELRLLLRRRRLRTQEDNLSKYLASNLAKETLDSLGKSESGAKRTLRR